MKDEPTMERHSPQTITPFRSFFYSKTLDAIVAGSGVILVLVWEMDPLLLLFSGGTVAIVFVLAVMGALVVAVAVKKTAAVLVVSAVVTTQ